MLERRSTAIPDLAIERRALQVCVTLAALIPLSAGLHGAMYGAALTDDTLSSSGESHFKYLSGLLYGIGLGFLSTVVDIERKSERFRLLTLIVVIGGLFRIVALRHPPWPSSYMLAGATMEVVVTPLLCLWQARIAARLEAAASTTALRPSVSTAEEFQTEPVLARPTHSLPVEHTQSDPAGPPP